MKKRGNSMKKEKMIAFSFSLFLGIITWFTLATSVRKGLPLLDASIFEYFWLCNESWAENVFRVI